MKPYLLAIISLTYINVSLAQDDSLLIPKRKFQSRIYWDYGQTLMLWQVHSQKHEGGLEWLLFDKMQIFIETGYMNVNSDIIYKNIHRWRYAKVKNYFPLEHSKISKIMPLGIAGDWCPPMLDGDYYVNGQRVEDAFLSGIECSKTLINKYFK